MSKTYLDQVNKTRALIAGLEKNYDQVKDLGVSLKELAKLKEVIEEGEKWNAEAERLRAETHEMVTCANQKLAEIKQATAALKLIVKQHFDISRWADFGVPDKR